MFTGGESPPTRELPKMTARVYNFSPGPAVLPEPVLRQAQEEMLSLPGLGMSVLEISHRSDEFLAIHEQAKSRLRKLLALPDHYTILFLQGGSRLQFAMIPMNFAGDPASAAYLVTGTWSEKAAEEAETLLGGRAETVCNTKATNYDRLPEVGSYTVPPAAAYAYYCSNETVQGVQFPTEPEVGGVPLICDASSDFLSRPLPIEKYALIYACAQKNAGPAGVTIVILRKELLDRCPAGLPGYLDYKVQAKHDSMFNTPPTFGIYMVNLVAHWLLEDVGGLASIEARNVEKSQMLYEAIDASAGFYAGHAQTNARSIMNVTFRLPNDELQQSFLEQSEAQGLFGLAGHRSVGGMRASIYNAMPVAGVTALRDFMQDFAQRNA